MSIKTAKSLTLMGIALPVYLLFSLVDWESASPRPGIQTASSMYSEYVRAVILGITSTCSLIAFQYLHSAKHTMPIQEPAPHVIEGTS